MDNISKVWATLFVACWGIITILLVLNPQRTDYVVQGYKVKPIVVARTEGDLVGVFVAKQVYTENISIVEINNTEVPIGALKKLPDGKYTVGIMGDFTNTYVADSLTQGVEFLWSKHDDN